MPTTENSRHSFLWCFARHTVWCAAGCPQTKYSENLTSLAFLALSSMSNMMKCNFGFVLFFLAWTEILLYSVVQDPCLQYNTDNLVRKPHNPFTVSPFIWNVIHSSESSPPQMIMKKLHSSADAAWSHFFPPFPNDNFKVSLLNTNTKC